MKWDYDYDPDPEPEPEPYEPEVDMAFGLVAALAAGMVWYFFGALPALALLCLMGAGYLFAIWKGAR